MLIDIQVPSITQANPQARGLSPTLSEPIIREISPGIEIITPDRITTNPAINEYPIKNNMQIKIPNIPDLATAPIA